MAFSFGSFAGGLGGGLDAGMQTGSNFMQMYQQQQGQQAWANTLSGMGGQGQQSSPQPGSMPMLPGGSAMPGAQQQQSSPQPISMAPISAPASAPAPAASSFTPPSPMGAGATPRVAMGGSSPAGGASVPPLPGGQPMPGGQPYTPPPTASPTTPPQASWVGNAAALNAPLPPPGSPQLPQAPQTSMPGAPTPPWNHNQGPKPASLSVSPFDGAGVDSQGDAKRRLIQEMLRRSRQGQGGQPPQQGQPQPSGGQPIRMPGGAPQGQGQPGDTGGMQGVPDQYMRGLTVLRTMAQAIKQANPGASPQVIASAMQIGMGQLNPMIRQEASDAYRWASLAVRDQLGQANLGERSQHDRATEGLGQGRLDETVRRDTSKEADAAQRISQAQQRIEAAMTKQQQAQSDFERQEARRDLETAIKERAAVQSEISKGAGMESNPLAPKEARDTGAGMVKEGSSKLKSMNEDAGGASASVPVKPGVGGNPKQQEALKRGMPFVTDPATAQKLPPGTHYMTDDGEFIR